MNRDCGRAPPTEINLYEEEEEGQACSSPTPVYQNLPHPPDLGLYHSTYQPEEKETGISISNHPRALQEEDRLSGHYTGRDACATALPPQLYLAYKVAGLAASGSTVASFQSRPRRSNSLIPIRQDSRPSTEPEGGGLGGSGSDVSKHLRSNSLTPAYSAKMETLQLPGGRRCSITSDSSALSSASSMSDVWCGPESGDRRPSPQYGYRSRLPPHWDYSPTADNFKWNLVKDSDTESLSRMGSFMSGIEEDSQNDETGCGPDGRSMGLDPAWNSDTLGIESVMRRSSTMSDYERRSSGIESDYERRYSDDSYRKSGSFSLDRRRSSALSWDFERRGSSISDDRRDSVLSGEGRTGIFGQQAFQISDTERRESHQEEPGSFHTDRSFYSGDDWMRQEKCLGGHDRTGVGRGLVRSIQVSTELSETELWPNPDQTGSESAGWEERCGPHPFSLSTSSTGGGGGSHFFSQDPPSRPTEAAKAGIRNLNEWLKSLRLHKYSHFFHHLTYDELVNISEPQLEQLNITKGARRKILSSVQKLKERPALLRSINEELEKVDCDMKGIITELEGVLRSPLPPLLAAGGSSPRTASVSNASTEEEPSLTELACVSLRKVCTSLLLSPHTDAINVARFVSLLDICLNSEPFLPTQKQLFASWKQKIRSIWTPVPPRRSSLQFSRKPSASFLPLAPASQGLGRRLSLQSRSQFFSGWSPRGGNGSGGAGIAPSSGGLCKELVRSQTTILVGSSGTVLRGGDGAAGTSTAHAQESINQPPRAMPGGGAFQRSVHEMLIQDTTGYSSLPHRQCLPEAPRFTAPPPPPPPPPPPYLYTSVLYTETPSAEPTVADKTSLSPPCPSSGHAGGSTPQQLNKNGGECGLGGMGYGSSAKVSKDGATKTNDVRTGLEQLSLAVQHQLPHQQQIVQQQLSHQLLSQKQLSQPQLSQQQPSHQELSQQQIIQQQLSQQKLSQQQLSQQTLSQQQLSQQQLSQQQLFQQQLTQQQTQQQPSQQQLSQHQLSQQQLAQQLSQRQLSEKRRSQQQLVQRQLPQQLPQQQLSQQLLSQQQLLPQQQLPLQQLPQRQLSQQQRPQQLLSQHQLTQQHQQLLSQRHVSNQQLGQEQHLPTQQLTQQKYQQQIPERMQQLSQAQQHEARGQQLLHQQQLSQKQQHLLSQHMTQQQPFSHLQLQQQMSQQQQPSSHQSIPCGTSQTSTPPATATYRSPQQSFTQPTPPAKSSGSGTKDDMCPKPVSSEEQLQQAELDSQLESLCLSVTRHALD